MCFCVFGREEKKLRNHPGKEQKPRKLCMIVFMVIFVLVVS